MWSALCILCGELCCQNFKVSNGVRRESSEPTSDLDARAPNHTQPHNKEDEDLEVVYGIICKYGSN